MKPLSDKKGVSRLLSSWYIKDLDRYYRDSEYGGKAPALAALLLDRFKHELKDAELDSENKGYIKVNIESDTGMIGVSRPGYRKRGKEYFSVPLTRIKDHSYANIPIEKFGEELSFKIAAQIRHWYMHYVYGEEYHKKRNEPENQLPDDGFLEELGIQPVPDFQPYQYPEPDEPEQEKKQEPEQEPERKKIFVAKDKTPENKAYEEFPHIPRIQGVHYIQSIEGFTATMPNQGGAPTTKTFTVAKYGPEKAFALAANARHQHCKDYYGDQYEEVRQDEGNLLPSDAILKQIGINPDGS